MHPSSADFNPRDTDREELKNLYGENADWVREGLVDLRDVPPMQISNERLREAILGGGLTGAAASEAARPWWSWSWAPIAAGATALAMVGVIQLRRNPSDALASAGALGHSRIIAPDTVALGSAGSDSHSSLEERFSHSEVPIASDPVVPQVTKAPSPFTASKGSRLPIAVRRVRRDKRQRDASAVDSSRVIAPLQKRGSSSDKSPLAKAGGGLVALANADAATPPADATAPTVAALQSALAPSRPRDEPIVLLASEPDPATGAVAAMEVDSHVNVTVGG